MDDQIKIAVLDQKFEDLKPIILKLDATIEKLSDVNTNVSRLLAVHEERISKQEEIDEILFDKIDKLRDKMDRNNDNFLQRLRQVEKRVWISFGAITVISLAINTTTFLTKTLTPSVDQVIMTRSS
jgi:hypothetical protein